MSPFTKTNIFVSVPPRIQGSHLPAEELSVVVRQPLRIECLASGTPEPTMTWFKDGFELDFNEARHIRIHPGGHILQIMGATVEDAGKYMCSATNAAGKDTKLFKLDVYGELCRTSEFVWNSIESDSQLLYILKSDPNSESWFYASQNLTSTQELSEIFFLTLNPTGETDPNFS